MPLKETGSTAKERIMARAKAMQTTNDRKQTQQNTRQQPRQAEKPLAGATGTPLEKMQSLGSLEDQETRQWNQAIGKMSRAQIERLSGTLDSALQGQKKQLAATEQVFSQLHGQNATEGLREQLMQQQARAKKTEERLNQLNAAREQAIFREYEDLHSSGDFAENSGYRTTANGKEAKMHPLTGTYAETGFGDVYYDYINGNQTARDVVLANDTKAGTTHAGWKDLPAETVATFNYLYATRGKDAAYDYLDRYESRGYTGIESALMGAVQGSGAASAAAALGGLTAGITGDQELKDNNRTWYGRFLKDAAGAKQEHPAAYGAGSVGGSLALLSGVGAAAGAGAAAAGMSAGALGTQTATGALSFAGANALQNAGAAATGYMDGGDYLKGIAVAGTQGMAGSLAGGLVGSGMAGVLRDKGLMTPFMEFVRQTASGMTNATVNQAVGYAAAEEKPSAEDIATGLATAFAFSVLTSAVNTVKVTQAQRANMESAYKAVERGYAELLRGTENMTPEAKAQRAQVILEQTQRLRESVNSQYIAGQQQAVNKLNGALDVIEQGMQNYVNGYSAAYEAAQAPRFMLPGAGNSGMLPTAEDAPTGPDTGLTQELQGMLQTAIRQGMTQAERIPGAEQWAAAQAGNTMAQQADTARPDASGQIKTASKVETGNKGETVGVVQNLKNNIPNLSQIEPVYRVSSQEVQTQDGRSMAQKAKDLFERIKGTVTRNGLGVVEINTRSVKDDLSHGVGPAKAAVIPAIPSVIQEGAQIDFQKNWKGRPYDGYVFAAPVELDGQTVYVAAVVLQTSKNRFYLHEVADSMGNVIKIGSENGANPTSLAAKSDAGTPITLPTVPSISQQGANVNGAVLPTAEDGTSRTLPTADTGDIAPDALRDDRLPSGVDSVSTPGYDEANTERRTGYEAAGEDQVSDGDGRWVSGERAGGQSGILAEGGPQRAADTGRAAAERQNTGRALRLEKVSSRDLGLENGTTARTLSILPRAEWDAELQQVGARVEQETGRPVTMVLGGIRITDGAGTVRSVRGVYSDNGIIVQADNLRLSPGQIADHEIFHSYADENPGLIQAVERAIVERYGREEFDGILDRYVKELRGVVDLPENATAEEFEDALLDVKNELFADAYAGINAFGAHAEQYQDTVQQTLEERGVVKPSRETAAATDRRTGPPERYSYAGANANGANLESLREAQEMQETGADMESIRKATGWHQFADGKWRFEIDDSRMQLRTDAADIPNYTTLGELVNAPELFEAYPDMADLSVTFHTLEDGQNGGYSRKFDSIELSRDLKNRPEALLNSLIHEVQHAIQNREGFASGANPAYWNRRMENGFDSRTAEERREGAQLQEQYEQMRESDPQFVAAMEELDAMAPKVPRGKIDLNTWEQIEPDPPEWVRYDERRDQLEEQYGDRVWDWYSLRDSIDRNARNGGRMPTDLYRDTAGEIEARDVSKRRELTAQERKETSPDYGSEDTVFADGGDGYAMSRSEQDSVKKQLREHQNALNNMKAVATIRDNGWKGMSTGAFRQKIVNDLKKTGYRVDNPSIGVIDFDEKLLNRSLNYIQTDAEAAAYQALPQVLKRGIEISGHDNHKGRDYETLTIAAPVELNGKRGNMAVVVMKTKGNRYKVHRILTPEGEAFALPEMTNAELNTVGAVTSGSQSLGGSAPAISSASETDAAIAENPSPGTNRSTASVSANSISETGGNVNGEEKPVPEARLRTYAETEAAMEQSRARYSVDDEAAGEAAPPKEPEKKERKPKTTKPVAESLPIIAKKDFRQNMLNLFSIPAGMRAELGAYADQLADKLLASGELTQADRNAFFDRMYESGVVTMEADEYFQNARQTVLGRHIYVPEGVKHEFGDDWNDFRRQAFAAGVIFTNDRTDNGIDAFNMELSERLPGLFRADDTDERIILERIVQMAEEGEAEKVSLAEYTAMLAGEEYVSEREVLDNIERQMDWALRTFAEKAKLEIKLRDRTGVKIAQEREKYDERKQKARDREVARRADEEAKRRDRVRKQRDEREMRELQQKTLKQLQWLNKNRNRAPEELRSRWDDILSDIDTLAIGAANEMNWSRKYGATWGDLAQMYKDAQKNDPNFLPSKELENIVNRLDKSKIADLDMGALQDLYKAAVGLRTEFYNRNNVIGDEEHRIFEDVYADSTRELRFGADTKAGKNAREGRKLDRLFNTDQLSPMNVMQRMAGWNPNSTFYAMAKQLEKGERDIRAYTVKANQLLRDFLTEHEDWVKKADGQGKDAVWYEVEVPELLELGMGDKPVFGDTVKVYMTPAQKIHMYLESKSYDNLRHMAGGRTFADRELYSQGKRSEAFAQGRTIRLAPETVKKLVSDLTPEEQELAGLLENYYNQFAAKEINQVSNILYGYDKAVSRNYAPIYTNKNYTKSELGVFDTTAEGVGNLKARQYSKNPSYNIGAFDAFERHIEQTARFTGMAIPARNWQTLLNWREKNNSMSDVISHTWGNESLNYIKDIIQTLQGGQSMQKDSAGALADTVFSNYISAVFGFNPSIVFKQLGSIPLASAWLGPGNIPSPAQISRIDRDLIAKYTQELDWRTMGYSTPETKQLKDNPNWTQSNKAFAFLFGGDAITAMDGWAASVLWPWAENKVRREYPELETGTQAQIDSGASPFYRKVAEEFNEAVARSQSTSDEMHQGTLRKSKNPVTRAFTMFKSDSSQTYNALRQYLGEAGYYKRAGDQQGRSRAQKAAGAAFIAAVGGYAFAQMVEFLMNLWKHKGKAYRDEDGNLTAESVAREMVTGLMGDLAGIVTGGEELADVIGNILNGDSRWYGIDTPGLEQLSDVIETVISSGKGTIQTAKELADVVMNGGSPIEYLSRHGGDIAGGIKEFAAAVATYLPGLPANNLEAYLLGTVRWISPELGTAYEDALATADKDKLSGLKGEALERRVRDILSNRSVEQNENTAAVLAELYEAGYRGAVPGDTPGSVTVGEESRKLNAWQQQTWDKVWSGTVGDSLKELTASEAFRTADDATREKMLRSLYDYAGEKAKAVLFGDYEVKSGTEKADQVLASGADMSEYLELKVSGAVDRYLKAIENGASAEVAMDTALSVAGLEPEDGKKSVTDVQRWRAAIDAVDGTKAQKEALMAMMSDAARAKYEIADQFGIEARTWVRLREILPQFDADGNGSYNGSEVENAIDALNGNGIMLPGGNGPQQLTNETRAVLWQLFSGSKSAMNNPYSVSMGRKVLEAKEKK